VEELIDPLDYQHLVLDLDLPDRLGVKALERYLTRYQRARKGSEQSAARRRDNVVERGVVGFYVFRRDPVMFRDLAVDTEEYRLILDREISAPDLTLHRLHPDLRDVLHLCHVLLLSRVRKQYTGD
jgi:hypothetical protein